MKNDPELEQSFLTESITGWLCEENHGPHNSFEESSTYS